MQSPRSVRSFSAARTDIRRGRIRRRSTLAGIERETPNPHNGIIERDANGDASGTLRESAQDIVRAVDPAAHGRSASRRIVACAADGQWIRHHVVRRGGRRIRRAGCVSRDRQSGSIDRARRCVDRSDERRRRCVDALRRTAAATRSCASTRRRSSSTACSKAKQPRCSNRISTSRIQRRSEDVA